MTNYDKWRLYTSTLPSPDNYIDWSWYYIVAAALQRRVWMGSENQQLFPNMYVILVGPPGTGKGLVLKEVTNLLRYWTLDMSTGPDTIAKTPEEKAQIAALVETNLANATKAEYQGNGKGKKDTIKPLLIPVAADATTYEALVLAVGASYAYINYRDTSKEPNRIVPYGHSSLCFILQELSSLMRKRTNDTVNYLLGIYDCPKDYEYTTITRGKDRVRRGCLNIIAGTTPSFMQSTFDEGLIGEGFTSRTFYIYAPRNRFNVAMFHSSLSPEQEEAINHLREHIRKLSSMYGPVKITPEAAKWFQEWWNELCEKQLHANKSPEMIPYYARLNIHVMKLAMCLLLGEDASTDEFGKPKGEVTIEILQRAIAILRKEEVNMHHALVLEGNNPVSKAAQRMLELLRHKAANWIDLYIACSKMAKKVEIEEALEMLQSTNQITSEDVIDKITQDTIKIYKIK